MFDAKNLLEAMMGGAHPNPPQQQQGMGGLGDILGQLQNAAGQGGGGLADILGKMMQGGGAGPQQQANNAGGGQGGGLGGLGDILGKLGGAGGGGAPQAPAGNPAGGQGGGGLGDILGQLQKQMSGGAGQAQGGGSLMDILTQVLGQATSGVKQGAGKLDEMTGASGRAKEAIGQATGKSPDELLAQLQELIKNNQLGAGAAMTGLGGLVLGTKTGRSAAISAAKLGALVMIGGLAYKAYQNYAEGKPVVGPAASNALVTGPAPAGSGFEPQAISNDTAVLYLRAMIAAAAADGRIDESEQKKILGGLGQAGIDDAAHTFLRKELANPASPEDLAGLCKSPAEALQVYTAARLAIEPEGDEDNQAFLAALAEQLGIDAKLASHIEATARASAG